MFFAQQTRRSPPSGNPLTTHQSHRPRLQPWFCEMFPICVSVQFPRDLGHAFSQHWPAVLQGLLFSDGRWKLCGDQDAQGRHFFWVLWIWNDFDHFKMLMIFPKKLRCWGVLHLFSLAMEMVDSCFIHIESRRSVSGTNGRVHSFWRFLHLHSQNSVSKAAILGTAMESPKKKRIFKKT